MVLSPLGYLGLGVASPARRLDLLGNVRIEVRQAPPAKSSSRTGRYVGAWATHDEQHRRRRQQQPALISPSRITTIAAR